MSYNYYSENALNELGELGANSLGVIQKDGGFTGNHTSRILVIGLGGMGLKTVLKLKKELNDRLGKIDPGFLRILAIDTDKDDREKALESGLLVNDEIPLLNNTDIGGALAALPEFRPRPIGGVIPEGFTQALNGIGANQVRLAGRLTVMDLNLFSTIYNSIKRSISELQDFSTTTLDVHVVAGIGGGTGSGLCIDIPYIVRAVVRDLALPKNRLRVFGHIYLPNAYSGISNMEAAYRNGYAALKEIDYYMNLVSNGETFDALYPAPVGRFSTPEPLFTQCSLVGGRIAGAIVMADPQEKAISVCVEDLVNQCTSVKGNVENGKSGSITDFFTAGSFHVNSATALNFVMANPNVHFPENGNYHYNLIGSSSIKFPTDSIVEQLVGKVSIQATALMKKNADTLTQKDVDDFEANLARPTDIIERYAKALAQKIDDVQSDPETKWTKSSILTNSHTVPLDALVTDAINSFDKDNSIIEKIVAEANRRATILFTEQHKGPYFLEKLLTSQSSQGSNVQGYYEKLRGYSTAVNILKQKCDISRAEYDKQRRELADTMQKLGRFNSNLDTFKELLKNSYLAKFKARLCDSLISEYYIDMNMARGLSYRIKSSLDRDFLGFVDVYDKLSQVLAENAAMVEKNLSTAAQDDPSSIFSLHDPAFAALQSSVANTVNSKMLRMGENAPAQYGVALASSMINNRKDWSLTENCPHGMSKAAASFRRFIKSYEPFADIVNRRMVDYFEDAYAGQTDAFKSNMIQKLIDAINYNSAPMCNVWQSPHFDFALVDQLCYRYLVLPDGFSAGTDAAGWGAKFSTLFGLNGNSKNIYWSPDQDSIYSYTLYAKMPVWIHEDLTKYEKEYERIQIPGVHIDESPSANPAMKDYPAIMPPSQWFRTRNGNIEYSNQRETELFARVRELVDAACSYGLLAQNAQGGWGVHLINQQAVTPENVDRLVKKFIENAENTDSKGNLKIKENLFAAVKAAFPVEQKNIIGRVGNAASDVETVVTLLRNQMRLLVALEDSLAYFCRVFLSPVAAEDNKRIGGALRRDVTKYMLFDLIFPERGTWKYRLGDSSYPIVSGFAVQDNSKTAWMVEFMEMAVCDAFPMVENFAEHKALLDERVRTIQHAIADGDEAAYNKLTARFAELKARCDGVVGTVENRRLNGNILTAQEESRKEFYTDIRNCAANLMQLFEM